jgi:hypothetical protein
VTGAFKAYKTRLEDELQTSLNRKIKYPKHSDQTLDLPKYQLRLEKLLDSIKKELSAWLEEYTKR